MIWPHLQNLYAQKSKLSITHCDIIFNCSERLFIKKSIKSKSVQQHRSITSIIVNNVICEFTKKLAISILNLEKS